MKSLKQSLKSFVTARYFPTLTKPILVGAVGSGVVYALHAAFGINVLPGEAENAVAPLVGLLLAAVAQHDTTGAPSASAGTAHVTVVAHTLSGEPTVGKSIATSLVSQIADALDANPQLVQSLAVQALEHTMNPPVAVPTQSTISSLLDAVATAEAKAAPAPDLTPVVPSAAPVQPSVSPASEVAPHITQ